MQGDTSHLQLENTTGEVYEKCKPLDFSLVLFCLLFTSHSRCRTLCLKVPLAFSDERVNATIDPGCVGGELLVEQGNPALEGAPREKQGRKRGNPALEGAPREEKQGRKRGNPALEGAPWEEKQGRKRGSPVIKGAPREEKRLCLVT